MGIGARVKEQRRVKKELRERQGNRLTMVEGRVIARATGTAYKPAHQFPRSEGGGVLYEFTYREPIMPAEIDTIYGRTPLNVKRNPVTGLYDIVP